MAWDLTIAGTSQTTPRRVRAGSLTINDPINERSTASFEIMSENLGYRPAVGAAVVITNPASVVEFGGEIVSTHEEPFGNNIRLLTRVECVGYDVYADRVLVTETIAAGQTLFQILTILVAYIAGAPYSVSLHPSQEDPGPTLTAGFDWDHKPLSECLAELTQATGYVRKINPTKHLRMWAPGAVTPPAPWDTGVTDSETHSLSLSIGRTRDDYVNRVYVRAGAGTVVRTQEWTSDGTQTAYVADVPAAVGAWAAGYVHVPAGGTGYYPYGIEGVETMPFTWDPVTATLHYNFQQIGDPTLPAPPLPVGTTVAIDYTAQYPFTVMRENSPDIATYGLREGVIDKPDLFDPAQALVIAIAALSTMDAARQTIELETREAGLASGQVLEADSTLREIDNGFLLTSVKITVDDDPGPTGDGVFRYVAEGEGGQTYRGSFLDTYRVWSLLGGGGGISGAAPIAVTNRSAMSPVWLGGSRDPNEGVICDTWQPVRDYQEFWLRGEDWPVARVRTVSAAADAGKTITARFYNLTTGVVVATGAPVTGTTWTEDIFAVHLGAGWQKYRLEIQGSDADPCYAMGLLEPLPVTDPLWSWLETFAAGPTGITHDPGVGPVYDYTVDPPNTVYPNLRYLDSIDPVADEGIDGSYAAAWDTPTGDFPFPFITLSLMGGAGLGEWSLKDLGHGFAEVHLKTEGETGFLTVSGDLLALRATAASDVWYSVIGLRWDPAIDPGNVHLYLSIEEYAAGWDAGSPSYSDTEYNIETFTAAEVTDDAYHTLRVEWQAATYTWSPFAVNSDGWIRVLWDGAVIESRTNIPLLLNAAIAGNADPAAVNRIKTVTVGQAQYSDNIRLGQL